MKTNNIKRMTVRTTAVAIAVSTLMLSTVAANAQSVADSVVAAQDEALEKNTNGKGYGPFIKTQNIKAESLLLLLVTATAKEKIRATNTTASYQQHK